MSNIEKLSESSNKNNRLFADTILAMKQSQGFYCRLFNAINELSDDGLDQLSSTLQSQNFNDTLDVIFWLECQI